jgi:uncharacterized protein (TIGR02118 family)
MVRFLVLYDVPDDPNEFDRHYREIHVPLAKQLPGLRRYTVSRNVSAVRGGEPFYLVAELDWDTLDDLKAAFQSAEGQATASDVDQFAPTGVQSVIYELEDL